MHIFLAFPQPLLSASFRAYDQKGCHLSGNDSYHNSVNIHRNTIIGVNHVRLRPLAAYFARNPRSVGEAA